MGAAGSKPAAAPLISGAALLLQAAAASLLLRADDAAVYLLGRPIVLTCAFRQRTGLPCPTCGLSRSVVLSLHGEFARAWHLAPAGPVAVLGALAFGCMLLVLAGAQIRGTRRWESAARNVMRRGAWVYAVALGAIWIGGWAHSFSAARRARSTRTSISITMKAVTLNSNHSAKRCPTLQPRPFD
jgi:hypothetical protein